MTYKALTIATSDSGGCAGTQADIKTFSALGVFSTSVLVSVTSQNTLGVTHIEPLSIQSINTQIDAVMSDIGATAVKTGMLYSSEIIRAVAKKAHEWRMDKLVVDPVMVSSTGAVLMQKEAADVMLKELLPLARLITPNIPEAEAFTHMSIKTLADKKEACKRLAMHGVSSVLLKGGHNAGKTEGVATDLWYDGKTFYEFTSDWVDTRNLHGTGCTLSAAITAYLARGITLEQSIRKAKIYIAGAIKAGKNMQVGHGDGPVNHFWEIH